MPSQPVDSGWDFSSVYDLIDSDPHEIGSPSLRPETQSLASVLRGGAGLGDFGKLYENLGWPKDASRIPLPPLDDSELSNSDDALLPSPLLRATPGPLQKDDKSSAQATGVDDGASGLTKKQRQRARKQAEKTRQDQVSKLDESKKISKKKLEVLEATSVKDTSIVDQTSLITVRVQSDVDAGIKNLSSESTSAPKAPQVYTILQRPAANKKPKLSAQPSTPKYKPQTQTLPTSPAKGIAQQSIPMTPSGGLSSPQQFFQLNLPLATPTPTSHSLVPRTVQPVTVPRQSLAVANQARVPVTPSPVSFPSIYGTPSGKPTFTIRSQVDRHMSLFNKLMASFPDDRKWLVAPKQLVNETTQATGVHIFVDASNIMFGFRDMLRTRGVQLYDMSFDSLALLMERRRPVAKRVFVGSHREAKPLPQVSKLVETSKAVGYECNVQEQVYIVREESEKKKFYNDVKRVGWHRANKLRSGSGSDSETGTAVPKTPSAPKWVEQGVDELLHLKMCQSIIDTEEPTTMVLATGDGAAAEMSDGFLAHVERALKNGWKVELITWKQQTNSGYKRKSFRQKWGDQFTIIELDDFLEDLIDAE